MQNEVNVQRSKLLADGMLHIELLDGNSYLYSLQEIADIIASQQLRAVDQPTACPACGTLPEEMEHDPTCSLVTAGN